MNLVPTRAVTHAVLDAAEVVASMSRTENYWDNAVAESFFATLEHELIGEHD